MNVCYTDILSRLGDPLWWDERAVPRYAPFHPELCDIYAEEVILMKVACQHCERTFPVAMSRDHLHPAWEGVPHYGDPPNIRCCSAGPTANVEFHQVLEWWKCDKQGEWHPKP